MTGQALDDPDRLQAIEHSGLVGEMSREALERVSRLVTHITGAPLALVNVVDDRNQTSIAGVSALPRFTTDGIVPLTNSFCQHVVTDGASLTVNDARLEPRLDGNLGVTQDGVMAYLGVPLFAPSGHILGALCAVDENPRQWTDGDRRAMDDLGAVIADELALREANRKIERLMNDIAAEARRDPLTQLGNRRLWHEQGEIELSRARRDGTPLSVVLFDLDGFKAVNDVRGHAAGDQLLRELAVRWAPLVRLPDLLVRIGGDEFAALLPGAGAADGEMIGERLRAGLPEGIGVSFGVAQWEPGEEFETMVVRADRELYARKRAR